MLRAHLGEAHARLERAERLAVAGRLAATVAHELRNPLSVIETSAFVLAEHARGIPLVLDPVMVAKGGARLLDEDAVEALRRRVFPLAALVTPNMPEAEALAGMAIPDLAALRRAGEAMLSLGLPAVLLKGGHLPGPVVTDLLMTGRARSCWSGPASTPGTRTVRDAPWPVRLRPGWRRAGISLTQCVAPAPTFKQPSPRRPASAAGTGRSATA